MAYSDNPGSIHHQLGRTLNHIRLNVEQRDLPGIQNHVRMLRALCGVFLTKTPEWKETYQGIALGDDDTEYEEQFELEMTRLETLLGCFAANGVYAFVQPDAQDASAWALTDEVTA